MVISALCLSSKCSFTSLNSAFSDFASLEIPHFIHTLADRLLGLWVGQLFYISYKSYRSDTYLTYNIYSTYNSYISSQKKCAQTYWTHLMLLYVEGLSLLNLHCEAATDSHLHLVLVAALYLDALLEEVAANLIGIRAINELCYGVVAIAQE